MSKLDVIRLVDMSFYRCEGEECRAIYAIEEDKVDEPNCPACGCEYFSFVALQKVEY